VRLRGAAAAVNTLADFDYHLPKELIAQVPAGERSASRLLVLDRSSGRIWHRTFGDLPGFLRPGDVLVLNDARVIPARIETLRRTGGKVELLLLAPLAGADGAGGLEACVTWVAMARPAARLQPGERLDLLAGGHARLLERRPTGEWEVSFSGIDGQGILGRGRMPLPHYIDRRWQADERDDLDRERYQTVYACRDGAVAAPTAGLHFTREILQDIESKGISIAYLTLTVGAGTFLPVREDDFANHVMHKEWFSVPAEAARTINAARQRGGRVVAVGTTSTRALESAADPDGMLSATEGWTGIFIYPPYRFKAVDVLATNFHLPRSTLLLLVAAFAGRERILEAYGEAVARGYRFFSYGDAMLIL